MEDAKEHVVSEEKLEPVGCVSDVAYYRWGYLWALFD
jgi:hypothetical protein